MKHKGRNSFIDILIRREKKSLLEELNRRSFTISLAEEAGGLGEVKYSNDVVSLEDVVKVLTPEEVEENAPFETGDEVIVVGNESGHNLIGDIFTISKSGPTHSGIEDDFKQVIIENSDIIKLKYPKVGQKVIVVANNTGHEFDIGTTLTVYHPGEIYSTLKSEDEYKSELRNDEFEIADLAILLDTDGVEETPKVEKLKSHGELTVDEVKRKKRELKEGLFNLLNQFYEETGVKVHGKIYNSPINGRQAVNLDFSNPID